MLDGNVVRIHKNVMLHEPPILAVYSCTSCRRVRSRLSAISPYFGIHPKFLRNLLHARLGKSSHLKQVHDMSCPKGSCGQDRARMRKLLTDAPVSRIYYTIADKNRRGDRLHQQNETEIRTGRFGSFRGSHSKNLLLTDTPPCKARFQSPFAPPR